MTSFIRSCMVLGFSLATMTMTMTLLGGCDSRGPAASISPVQRSWSPLASTPGGLASPDADLNKIFSLTLTNGMPVAAGGRSLPPTAYGPWTADYSKPGVTAPDISRKKLDDLLESRVSRAEYRNELHSEIDVVITFKDTLTLPIFPRLDPRQARTSSANQAVLARAQEMVAQIEQMRAPARARRSLDLSSQHGATVRDGFWLIDGVTTRVSLGQVRAIAARSEVQFVEEDSKEIPPPVGRIVDARARMGTDPYYWLSSAVPSYIGMLDTGVRKTHYVLTNIDVYLDCVNGTTNYCRNGTNLDPSDTWVDAYNHGHGTKAANILTGNDYLGEYYRGVTGIVTDSFKVYDNVGLVVSATVRGFEAATYFGDDVILANVQDTGTEDGAIATAADAAFNAGVAVVAAAGNYGPYSGSVRSPGRAHKVIAVGAANVDSLVLRNDSGRGPATDYRTKPDVVGPEAMYTADNSSDSHSEWGFAGTSCATPNVTGAAALVRSYMQYVSASPPPGQVYAFLIMSGQGGGAYDNSNGAGLVSLPSGPVEFGSVSLTANTYVDISLLVSSPAVSLDAAVWWPEAPSLHNDIDMFLYDPNGGLGQGSMSGDSVFEKAHTDAYAYGYWRLRISAYSVTGTQTVYWSFAQRQ